MSSISLVGVGPNFLLPGTFLQVVLGAGASSGAGSQITALIMGNKLSTAPMTVDGYVYGPDVPGRVIANEADVIAQAGQGSELHLGYRKFVKTNPNTPVYLIAVAESAGASATRVVNISNSATANGSVRVFVADEFVDVAVASGDANTAVATAIASAINAQLNWPVTASAVSAAVTITAKNKGLRGNWIRCAVAVQGVIGTSSDASSFAYLSGGTVADVWTNALATILPKHYRYIVSPVQTLSSAQLIQAQVDNQALPTVGNRQRVVFAQTDTLGNSSSWAKSINDARCEVVWQPNCNMTPMQLAATACAAYSLLEDSQVPMLNFDNLGVTPVTRGLLPLSAPFDGSAPTNTDLNSALLAGLSPVRVNQNGSCSLVMRVTSYSQDPVAHTQDDRVRDGCIPTVMDLLADTLQAKLNTSFGNKLIAADPAPNQRPPGSGVVTPSIIKGSVNKVLQDFGDNTLLQNVDASKKQTDVQIESIPGGRVSVLVNAQVSQPLHQFAVLLNQLKQLQ